MTYFCMQVGNQKRWTAQPETPEELAWTINFETPWLDYDPNNIPEASDELLNMFL